MSLIKLALIKGQPHQNEAVEKLNKSNSLIAYHGLGSGKTLTSIIAGQKTPGTKLVLTPASLKENFHKELHKFKVSDKDYKNVSYERFRRNPNHFIDKYKPSMIIADEFHRSKNMDTSLGDTLREARKKVPKFLGLTGSIASNHPSEIAELVDTAAGKPIFGNVKTFNKHFINERIVKPGFIGRILGKTPGIVEEPKNLGKFKEMVSPYIHTFKGDEEYKKHIPLVDKEVKRINMDKSQQKVYDYTFGTVPAWVRWKIKNNLPPSKKESANLNAFLIGARQASTSTDPFGSHKSTAKIDSMIHDIRSGIKHDPNFKSVTYSGFIGAGINPISARLKKLNIPHGSFTGEQTDADRQAMVHDYNSGKIKHLLLSPAGGEGLDLKGTKLMQIADPSWNPEKTNQVIGRGARFKSHEMLPEDQRRMRVIQYLSEPKLGLLGKIKKIFKPDTHAIGVDEYIFNRAKEKQKLNDSFTNVLEEVK